MPATLQHNRTAFHQLCRQHLKTLGEKPLPHVLHGVQLAAWGLENISLSGEIAVDADDLDEAIAELLSLKPDAAERLLLGAGPGAKAAALKPLAAEKLALLRAAEDPEQAACWLAEDVFNRLSQLDEEES